MPWSYQLVDRDGFAVPTRVWKDEYATPMTPQSSHGSFTTSTPPSSRRSSHLPTPAASPSPSQRRKRSNSKSSLVGASGQRSRYSARRGTSEVTFSKSQPSVGTIHVNGTPERQLPLTPPESLPWKRKQVLVPNSPNPPKWMIEDMFTSGRQIKVNTPSHPSFSDPQIGTRLQPFYLTIQSPPTSFQYLPNDYNNAPPSPITSTTTSSPSSSSNPGDLPFSMDCDIPSLQCPPLPMDEYLTSHHHGGFHLENSFEDPFTLTGLSY